MIGSGKQLGLQKEHLIEIILSIEWEDYQLQDAFTWDITDPDNSPEEFAAQMVNDLELPPIFQTLIAYQIRR